MLRPGGGDADGHRAQRREPAPPCARSATTPSRRTASSRCPTTRRSARRLVGCGAPVGSLRRRHRRRPRPPSRCRAGPRRRDLGRRRIRRPGLLARPATDRGDVPRAAQRRRRRPVPAHRRPRLRPRRASSTSPAGSTTSSSSAASTTIRRTSKPPRATAIRCSRPASAPRSPSTRTARSASSSCTRSSANGSGDLAPVIDAVRAAVLAEHGLALDAVVLIRCGTIAKTSSGKVQRHASRAAFLAGELQAARPAPRASDACLAPARRAAPRQSAALAAVCQHALAMSGTGLADVTPETPIDALGLDSLQRVELVAALDKSFGRHLPDTVYSQATTLGDLAAAVQKHLIDHPQSDAPARRRSRGELRRRAVPRIPRTQAPQAHAAGRRRRQSLLPGRPGRRHAGAGARRPRPHRRPRADQFLRLRLRRHGARPGRHRRDQGRDRSLRHQRRRQPPRLRREADPSRARARARRISRHARGDRLRLRARDQRHDDRPPDGPGRPDRPRRPRPQQHPAGRAALRRDQPRLRPQRLARARRAALGHPPRLSAAC